MPGPAIPRPTRAVLPLVAVAIASVAAGTLIVAALETWTDIPDASAVYLVAVVIVGWLGGTWPALATALVAFLVYDLLFTDPRFSLVVADPVELLNLVLVLIVALAVGRLAALGRERGDRGGPAGDRGDRARSPSAACWPRRETTASAAAGRRQRAWRVTPPLGRAWVGARAPGRDRATGPRRHGRRAGPEPAVVTTPRPDARRRAGPLGPCPRAGPAGGDRIEPAKVTVVRVKIETDGVVLGALWAIRRPTASRPTRRRPGCWPSPPTSSRSALRRDQLRRGGDRSRGRPPGRRAQERPPRFGVARPPDAAREHPRDGRQPGRSGCDAVAGRGPRGRRGHRRRGRAPRPPRPVVLDLSRIDSGTLRPDLEAHDLAALVERAVERLRPALGDSAGHVRAAGRTAARPRRRRPARHGRHEPARQRRPPHAPGHAVEVAIEPTDARIASV